MSSEKTANFQKEYQILRDIADEMQSKDIDDVDELIKKVEQGTKSYKICKERLDAAKLKLTSILQETNVSEDVDSTKPADKVSVAENIDNDIPF